MIPLGLYYPGESLNLAALPTDLRTFAQAGVNALWLTHRSSRETASVATQAASSGIRMVGAVGDLDVQGDAQAWKRDPVYWRNTIPAVLSDWGTAPRPLAWCLGDEPHPNIITDYGRYVATWRDLAPMEPLTVVVNRGGVDAYRTLGLNVLTEFSYPWFVDGTGGHGYYADCCRVNSGGWMMCQCFSKPNVWRVPTPAEVTWQVYTALFNGARGVFAFAWSDDPGPENLTTIQRLPDQWKALATAYRRASKWGVLETATLIEPGMFRSVDGVRYVIAVCGPDAAATVNVPSPTRLLQDVNQGGLYFARGGRVPLRMQAGEGRLFRVR